MYYNIRCLSSKIENLVDGEVIVSDSSTSNSENN